MLTWRPPYEGETISEIISNQNSAQLIPVHSVNPKVPGELCDTVHTMLAKDPDWRYQSYDQLIDVLKRFQLSMVSKERMAEADVGKRLRMEVEGEAVSEGAVGEEVSSSAARAAVSEEVEAEEERFELPAEPPRRVTFRTLLIMFGILLVFFAALTAVFNKVRERQEGIQPGRNLLGVVFRAIFKPKPPEEKLTGEDLYIYRCQETMRRMQEVREMMQSYVADKGKVPESLQELVDVDYVAEEDTRDGWGRDIIYIRTNGDLRSFGEDGIEDTTADIYLNAEGHFYRLPARYRKAMADRRY
jgi:hypothetical protein